MASFLCERIFLWNRFIDEMEFLQKLKKVCHHLHYLVLLELQSILRLSRITFRFRGKKTVPSILEFNRCTPNVSVVNHFYPKQSRVFIAAHHVLLDTSTLKTPLICKNGESDSRSPAFVDEQAAFSCQSRLSSKASRRYQKI